MDPSSEYRASAQECLSLAKVVVDPAENAGLISLAKGWLHLSAFAENNKITDVERRQQKAVRNGELNAKSGCRAISPRAQVKDSKSESERRPVWQTIVTAPFDREVGVAVLNERGYNVFALFVRRTRAGWVADRIDDFLAIAPTHWRERGRKEVR